MKIKVIKNFVVANKSKFINGACVVIGGLVVYGLTEALKTKRIIDKYEFTPDLILSRSITNEMADDPDYNFNTFDEAANKFKEYQGINNTVGMIFEDNNYQVFQLEQIDKK